MKTRFLALFLILGLVLSWQLVAAQHRPPQQLAARLQPRLHLPVTVVKRSN